MCIIEELITVDRKNRARFYFCIPMKKHFLLLILFLAGSQISAQEVNKTDSQGRKHGVWKKYYPNQKLRYEGQFDHGVEVDTFKFYFDDGSLKAINYFRDKGVAYSRQFGGTEEAQLAAEGKYVDAKRDSTWTFYDIDGNVVSREEYRKNLKHGKSVTYFENGKPAEVTHYEEGEKQGEWKQFYESGKPKAKGTYKNDKLQGEVTYFNLEGKPRIKGHYHKGLMHGDWFYFDESRDIEKTEVWKYGKKISSDPPEEEEDDEWADEN